VASTEPATKRNQRDEIRETESLDVDWYGLNALGTKHFLEYWERAQNRSV
jgi:hypothetical protein